MKFKVALIVAVIVSSSLLVSFFISMQQPLDISEEVPESRGRLIDTGSRDGSVTAKYGDYFAIKFIIPMDSTINVITDVYMHMGSQVHTTSQYFGLSRILTSNTGQWVTDEIAFSPYGNIEWNKVITDAKTKGTGSIVRCNPGETWYLMGKVQPNAPPSSNVGGWWYTWYKASSLSTCQSYYRCRTCTEWVEISNLSLRVDGYRDEVFYVDFDYTPKNPLVGEVVTFIDTSNQNLIESRQWLINGVVKYGSTVTYSFPGAGQYSASLIGVSYGGSNLQTTKIVEVSTLAPPPATNHAPHTPSNPNPFGGETNVDPSSLTLRWSCSDPDDDQLTYNVYFGTSPTPPIVIQRTNKEYYTVGSVSDDTAYYWQIWAFDDELLSTYGPVWTFSTGSANHPPNIPTNPDPVNGETDVSDGAITLYWDGSDPDGNIVTYDIYFGTDAVPSTLVRTQQSTHWKTPDLESSTNYYWKINTKDTNDVYSYGQTWCFTTESEITPPPSNDPPEIIDDSGNLNLKAGEIVTLWAKANDDKGVTSVLVEIDGESMGEMSYDLLQTRWEYTFVAPESGVSQTTYSVTVYDEGGLSDSISRYIFIDFSQHSSLIDQLEQIVMEYWQYILIGLAVLVLIGLLARRRG
jgi:hypothetical protein